MAQSANLTNKTVHSVTEEFLLKDATRPCHAHAALHRSRRHVTCDAIQSGVIRVARQGSVVRVEREANDLAQKRADGSVDGGRVRAGRPLYLFGLDHLDRLLRVQQSPLAD